MQADGSDESHRKETTSHKVWEPGNQIQILYQQILKWKVYQILAPCCSLGLSSWQRLNSQESAWSHSWESSHAWPLVDSPHAVCHPKAQQHRNIDRKPPPVRIVEVMVGHLTVFHILKVGSVNVSCVTIRPPWQSSKESENPKFRQEMNKVEAESASISFISLWYWRIAVTAIKTNLPLLRWSLHSSRSCHRNLHALEVDCGWFTSLIRHICGFWNFKTPKSFSVRFSTFQVMTSIPTKINRPSGLRGSVASSDSNASVTPSPWPFAR